MQFHDYYLKGADRESTRAALLAAGLTVEHADENGNPARSPAEGVNISTIGTITAGGEYAEDGTVITAPTLVPGWHVNLRLYRPLSAEQLAILGDIVMAPSPATPYRVWA